MAFPFPSQYAALRREFLLFAIQHAARTRDPKLCASLLARLARPAPWQKVASPKRHLLILDKGPFTEDIRTCFENDGETAITLLLRRGIKAVASAFLPLHLDDNNYLTGDTADDAAKSAYRDFLVRVWPPLNAKLCADAVLTGNFGYYAERELAAALEQCGTPFLVVQKENMKTPGLELFWEEMYRTRRGPFCGRRIFTYNEIERGIEIAAGVSPEDRVKVTGMPRLDRAHALRGKNPPEGRPSVLFFSFDPSVGLPAKIRKDRRGRREVPYLEPMGDARDALSWKQLHAEFHAAAVRFAREHPEIDVVVKAKAAQLANRGLSGLGEDRPSNLRTVVGGDPLELICQSRAVAGFTSTALLEAIAAGRPVVTPAFAEATLPEYRPFLMDLGPAAQQAASPEELIQMLARAAAGPLPGPVLPPEIRAVLRHWTGNDAGDASARLRRAILDELEKKQ